MNLKLTQRQKRERGFSLVEFSIVLAVAGVIFAGVWVVAASMGDSVKQERFSELLDATVDNVRGSYAGKPYFESTLVATIMPKLTAMNVFPGDTVHKSGSTSVVTSPFGELTNPLSSSSPYKSIYVCGWKDGSTPSTHCDLSGGGTANVPLFAVEAILSKKDCLVAALKNAAPSMHPGLVAFYINGSKITMPVTLSAVTTACNNNTNYADFVFRLTP